MRIFILLSLALVVGCVATPTQLQRFEHVGEGGSRITYTVDMFKEGKQRLQGYWVSFHPESDVKLTEGAHHNGKMHGVWTWWNKAGEITGQKLFRHGVVESKRDVSPWWNY